MRKMILPGLLALSLTLAAGTAFAKCEMMGGEGGGMMGGMHGGGMGGGHMMMLTATTPE